MDNANHPTILNTTFAADQNFFASHYQQPSLTNGMNISAQTVVLPDTNTGPNQPRQECIETESVPSRPHRGSWARNTSKTDRMKIKSAAAAGIATKEIVQRHGYTPQQIYYASRNSQSPKTDRYGRKPAVLQEKAEELVSWICQEPLNRRMTYQSIPIMAPELELQDYGGKAIRTAVESQGFGRRVSKRKGISNQEIHRQKRLELALNAREWDRQRLYSQMFSDEVWANWGANSRNFVTVQVAGDPNDIVFDRHRPECLTRKAARGTVWMFHSVIHDGPKAFGKF